MTAVEPEGVRGESGAAALERDLERLRETLATHRFPSQQDDLIAACLGQHAPARLCCRLAVLPRTHVYGSLEEVLDDVAARA